MDNAFTEKTGWLFFGEKQTALPVTDQMCCSMLVLFGEHLSLCGSPPLLTGSCMNEWVSTPGGPIALQK